MGDIAAWLQSWWNNLSPGARDNIIAGLIVAFIIGVIAFLRNVLIAVGRRIFREPVTQSSDQEWRSTPTSHDEQQQRRNLSVMRKAVRRIWIEGVLNKSLYKEVLIQLNMAERADAVANNPWNLELQQSGEASRVLPPNTRILDVFDQVGQLLLILGEPGSGKTTTLLELARDLLNRADQDTAEPTPVVFNLSSWAVRRLPLDEWLVDELRTRYSIPKDIAQDWIRHDKLILLLDGLDEVQEQYREVCITAINNFRQQHLVPLAVCSRTTEYGRLSQQLKLGGAVILQPLSTKQLRDYFDRAGESLTALRAAVQQDKDLKDMAESPLLLSIMTLAYQGASPAEVGALDVTQTRRQHLFDTYLARMFVRRDITHLFAPSKTFHWLRWLAQRMKQYRQTTFLIERMQPGWLQPDKARPWGAHALMAFWGPVYGLSVGLLGGLILGLLYGLILGLLYGLSIEEWITLLKVSLIGWLIAWLIATLSVGLISGLIDSAVGGLSKIRAEEQSIQFWTRLKSGFYTFALYGSTSALLYGLFYGLREDLIIELIRILFTWLIFGLIGGLIGIYRPIQRVQKPDRSWQTLRHNFRRILTSGLIWLPILGIPVILNDGVTDVARIRILLVVVIGGLIDGLLFEPSPQIVLLTSVTTQFPNQAIRLATRYIFISGFATLFAGGLVGGLVGGLIGGPELTGALLLGHIGALIGALIGGLIGGVDIIIKHYLLRLALWLQGSIPLKYVRFLDYAAALIFLRKVGSDYIFVHRLVLEHFAGLSDADIQRVVRTIPKQPARKG